MALCGFLVCVSDLDDLHHAKKPPNAAESPRRTERSRELGAPRAPPEHRYFKGGRGCLHPEHASAVQCHLALTLWHVLDPVTSAPFTLPPQESGSATNAGLCHSTRHGYAAQPSGTFPVVTHPVLSTSARGAQGKDRPFSERCGAEASEKSEEQRELTQRLENRTVSEAIRLANLAQVRGLLCVRFREGGLTTSWVLD